jgi:hypothetical protein
MYDQYATACCIEFCAKIWQLSHKKAQSYRYAYLRGIDWLRREMAKNDYYFVQNSIKSTYLTAIILSRIHHLLPKEFLWNALQNLIENSQQGTWVDETISDFEQKESSRYRTTVCVLNLFAKLPFRHDFIKESAFNGSLEFIFNRNVREEAEPRDLVFLLNIIDTLSEIKRVEKMINDEEIYDWWLPDNKSNTLSYSEIKRIDEFYQQWLEHSKRRSRGLQYGAFNLGNGYRIILREEEDLARQVRAFLKQNLKRLEREIFYRISLSDELPGLSPDILYRLRYAINKCGQLNNPNHLKAIFVDKRIFPWRGYIPDTGDLHEIIDRLIAFLYEKRHSETNKNGLVCFLEVLSDRLHKQDECHDIFKQLIIDLTR